MKTGITLKEQLRDDNGNDARDDLDAKSDWTSRIGHPLISNTPPPCTHPCFTLGPIQLRRISSGSSYSHWCTDVTIKLTAPIAQLVRAIPARSGLHPGRPPLVV